MSVGTTHSGRSEWSVTLAISVVSPSISRGSGGLIDFPRKTPARDTKRYKEMGTTLWHKIFQKRSSKLRSYKQGVHGDRRLISVANMFLSRADAFVEAGTNVGSTLSFVARRFRRVKCYGCEPDDNARANALAHAKDGENCEVHIPLLVRPFEAVRRGPCKEQSVFRSIWSRMRQ